MFNAQQLLGTLLGTGMGGHNTRFDRSESEGGAMGGLGSLLEGFSGSGRSRGGTADYGEGGTSQAGMGRMGRFAGGAGLAVLGALALNAYERYRQAQSAPSPQDRGTAKSIPGQEQAARINDGEAMLLIRAMVAAANADGQIDADEEKRILGRLDEAGASEEEREFVRRELRSPASVETLVRGVRDPEAAQRLYAASALAVEADTAAEQSYLRYLADRLGITPSDESLQRRGIGTGVA